MEVAANGGSRDGGVAYTYLMSIVMVCLVVDGFVAGSSGESVDEAESEMK
jgi:hypothetical protein